MGMVSSYNKPTTAGELARLVEVFFTDQFGMAASGGSGPDGGDLTFDLEFDDVSVLVIPSDQAVALKRGAGRVMAGERLDWLTPEEQQLIEAHRSEDRDEPNRPRATTTGEGAMEASHYFSVCGTDVVVETFAGTDDQWAEKEGAPEDWSALARDGEVHAVRIIADRRVVRQPPARYAAEQLRPSGN